MFHEIKDVKQEPGAGRRRWFESEDVELIVWLDAGERVTGFQLCYDFGRGEHALTWRGGAGFAHSVVDAGDATPLKNASPVLEPDGDVPWREVAREFEARSGTLEPALRELIRGKLTEQAEANAAR